MKQFIKNHFKSILILIFALQILSLFIPVANYFNIQETGKEYTLEVSGYDPYDILRGRYLRIELMDNEIGFKDSLKPENWYSKGNVYIVLEKRSSGPDGFSHATLNKPAIGVDYLKIDDWYYDQENDVVRFYSTLNKYYVNEELAPVLEKKLMDSEAKSYVTISVKKGSYIMKNIVIDDQAY